MNPFSMSDSLTIQEQQHSFWKTISIICGIFCIILFVVFWNTNDPFWTGIFRLGAFVFFAGTVLSYLKIMDGPLLVSLRSTDEVLLVSYQKKDETIQEEEFERNTIENITTTTKGKNQVTSYLQPGSAAFEIHFNDTDRTLFLFEFGGRPLLFNESSQQEITNYLHKSGIPS